MNSTASKTTPAQVTATATRTIKLRAVALSCSDAEAILRDWRDLWGERLSGVREPRCGREGDWLVYADLRLE